jgi:hypothetical protein
VSARKTVAEKAALAGRKEGKRHETYSEDRDGWTVCKCRTPFPSPEDWGDHYADFVLTAALNAVVVATRQPVSP